MIKFDNITIEFSNKVILKNASFNFDGNYSIIGRNGSGKTQILIKLFELASISEKKVALCGIELPPTIENLTIKEYFDAVFDFSEYTNKLKKEMDFFELDFNKIFNQSIASLSGGEKRIIQFIMAIMEKNELILLDEPEASMDKNKLIKLSKRLNELKSQVIIASHDPVILNGFNSKIIIIKDFNISLYEHDIKTNSDLIKVLSGREWVINENFK